MEAYMKKKILALFLSFVLLIPFVLIGCMPNNQTTNTTKSFYDEIKDTYKKEDSVSSADELVLDGTCQSSSSKFIQVVKDVSTDTHASQAHTVYDINTGVALVSVKLEREYATGKYSSLYKSVSVSYGDNIFVLSGTKASGTIEHTVFNHLGKEVVKGSDISYRFLTDNRFIFDNKLFVVDENGNGTMVKDLTDSYLYYIVDSLEKFGDSYLYVDSSYVAYVFNSSLEVKYTQQLKSSPASSYKDISLAYFYLNNGNILVQETGLICDFDPSINHNEYDYVLNGKCYDLNTYLFNIENGSYVKTNLPYVLAHLEIKDEVGSGIPYGYENMALGTKIDNSELVYTNGNEYAFLLLDNTAKYKECDLARVSILGENRYAKYDGFAYSIYDEKDNLVGKLDRIEDVNNDLIITPSAIYDHDLKVIYSLKNASVKKVLPDSVVVYSYDIDLGAYKYELVTKDNVSTIFVESSTNRIGFGSSFIYIAETKINEDKELCEVLKIYSSRGEELKSYEIDFGASIIQLANDNYSILRTVNKDSNVLLIILK